MSDWWIDHLHHYVRTAAASGGGSHRSFTLRKRGGDVHFKKYVGLFQRKAGGNARHMISLQVVKYSTQCLDAPGSG